MKTSVLSMILAAATTYGGKCNINCSSDEYVDLVNCECMLKAVECQPCGISTWPPSAPCGDGLTCSDIDPLVPEAGGKCAKKKNVVDGMSTFTCPPCSIECSSDEIPDFIKCKCSKRQFLAGYCEKCDRDKDCEDDLVCAEEWDDDWDVTTTTKKPTDAPNPTTKKPNPTTKKPKPTTKKPKATTKTSRRLGGKGKRYCVNKKDVEDGYIKDGKCHGHK